MKTLNLYTIKERKPKDKEQIFIFGNSSDSDGLDPHFARIEYSWIVVDKDGDTGTQIEYIPNKEIPSDCRLMVLDDEGDELDGGVIYAIPNDIHKIIESQNEKDKKEV